MTTEARQWESAFERQAQDAAFLRERVAALEAENARLRQRVKELGERYG